MKRHLIASRSVGELKVVAAPRHIAQAVVQDGRHDVFIETISAALGRVGASSTLHSLARNVDLLAEHGSGVDGERCPSSTPGMFSTEL